MLYTIFECIVVYIYYTSGILCGNSRGKASHTPLYGIQQKFLLITIKIRHCTKMSLFSVLCTDRAVIPWYDSMLLPYKVQPDDKNSSELSREMRFLYKIDLHELYVRCSSIYSWFGYYLGHVYSPWHIVLDWN